MKVTTVRFGTDLWRLLEAEAELAGVSVSQYIREAALARASAAVALRGEDPLARLAAATQTPSKKSAPGRSQTEQAAETRQAAVEVRSQASATVAQARQAVHRAQQVNVSAKGVAAERDKRLGRS